MFKKWNLIFFVFLFFFDILFVDFIYNKSEVRKYAIVQWYWQWDEISVRLRKLLKTAALPEGRVIHDLSNSYEKEIDLETIMGKCKVSIW